MPTDIFERSTITFRGTITAGHAAATSATFQLKRSGRTFASVDAPLREGAAEVR
ncbi:MAG: hypothetical protein IPF99_20880 [Deltaproteobacteria bacterium]|nr:hypothetical protein [Deltaproteobacteria bacterium]